MQRSSKCVQQVLLCNFQKKNGKKKTGTTTKDTYFAIGARKNLILLDMSEVCLKSQVEERAPIDRRVPLRLKRKSPAYAKVEGTTYLSDFEDCDILQNHGHADALASEKVIRIRYPSAITIGCLIVNVTIILLFLQRFFDGILQSWILIVEAKPFSVLIIKMQNNISMVVTNINHKSRN